MSPEDHNYRFAHDMLRLIRRVSIISDRSQEAFKFSTHRNLYYGWALRSLLESRGG